MNLTGMNVAQIRSLASQYERHAEAVAHSAREVDRLIQLAQRSWQGPDLADFDHRWNGSMRRVAAQVAQELRELSRTAKRNADTQERTSNELTGDGAGPGGGTSAQSGLPAGPGGSTPPRGDDDGPFSWVGDGLDWLGDRVEDGVEWTQDAGEWVEDKASDAWNWTTDRAGDAWDWTTDQAGDAWNWLEDRGHDVANFVVPRVEALGDGLARHGEAWGTAGSLIQDAFEGHPPQLSEVMASGVLILGTGGGAVANTIGGRDYKFLDPGTPGAGEPRDITGKPRIKPVHDLNSLTEATMTAYETNGIRVDTLEYRDENGNPSYRYIVNVPGTQAELGQLSGWNDNSNARNWAANLWAMTDKGEATNARAVEMAIRNAGVPEGAHILITGHSQGAIIAGNLAADHDFAARYNVDGVIAYGSPVENADLHPDQAPVLAFGRGNDVELESTVVAGPNGPMPVVYPSVKQIGDIVPQLDLGGFSVFPNAQQGNITEINLPPRGDRFFDMRANHEQVGYTEDVANMSQEHRAVVDQYIRDNDLDVYFQGTTTSSVAVETTG